MNLNFLSTGLVATMLATSLSTNAYAAKEDAGAIIGAIAGGLVGNQIGSGNGKAIATGLGIILGAVVGKDIGQQLDESDRRALEQAQRDCFQRPIGQQTDWDGNRYGSRTGSHGSFRTTREGYNRNNSREICREYQSIIVTRQKTENRTGVACYNANGNWTEVNATEVIFRNGTEIRTETVTTGHGNLNNSGYRNIRNPRPTPPPIYPPNYGGGYGSLRGYCPDYDHQEFYAAKTFAYSTSGMDLSSDQSAQWALNYVQTHRCGTIKEYVARFKALYSMAYSTSGLNMSAANARAYSAERVEYVTEPQIQQIVETATAVRSFVYSTSGLNRDSATAGRVAMAWIDRGTCGNAQEVEMIRQHYSKEYAFAYSTSGLNMSSNGARDYALGKISRYTRCIDLLRQ